MSQSDANVSPEGATQLSFSFESLGPIDAPVAQTISALPARPARISTTSVVVSFPVSRCNSGLRVMQAELIQRILHRSRFF